MELSVYNIKGEDTGKKITLPEEVFSIEPNEHAVYLSVKQYLANQRQGSHKSKERAEIAGSTRKIKRQKGTGTARAGSLKSPIFRSGGRVFGPRPRDYSFKLNKKVKSIARKSVLSAKATEAAIKVIEDFNLEAPQTKAYLSVLNSLSVSDKKSLLVMNQPNKNIYLSSRNIPKAKVTSLSTLNTYEIINADCLILSEGTIEEFKKLA